MLLAAGSSAAPLPEGSYADFLIVPVGPVPLAEFERDDRGAAPPDAPSGNPAAPGADPAADQRIPGGGSGVRVKEQDPAEIPPRAVYLRRAKDKFWRIPCFLNAIPSPVRVPLADSEITLLLEAPGARGSFNPLDTVRLPAASRTVLVLLTKPVGAKEWTRPQVTLIPVASADVAQLMLVNASHALACGVVVNHTQKLLLNPLKHTLWRPDAAAGNRAVPVSLAMAGPDQRFLAPFFNSHLALPPAATTILVAYEVTAEESFRRAKYLRGSFKPGDVRPAVPFPAEANGDAAVP
ncbi:MAG: hypothetical protein MUF04_12405 [Akkermansiaceae bacterium]|nr:hypothetical protein [Akkermansiaceae bacterium]